MPNNDFDDFTGWPEGAAMDAFEPEGSPPLPALFVDPCIVPAEDRQPLPLTGFTFVPRINAFETVGSFPVEEISREAMRAKIMREMTDVDPKNVHPTDALYTKLENGE